MCLGGYLTYKKGNVQISTMVSKIISQVDEQILIVPPWSGGNLNGAAKIVIEILNDVLLIFLALPFDLSPKGDLMS